MPYNRSCISAGTSVVEKTSFGARVDVSGGETAFGTSPTLKVISVSNGPPARSFSLASNSGFKKVSCCIQTEFLTVTYSFLKRI